MAVAVLSFPTLLERGETEFDRQGTSSYILTVTKATALWRALIQPQRRDRGMLARRIEALALRVLHLARYRPDRFADMVELINGGQIELQLVPKVLRAMFGPVAAKFDRPDWRAIGNREA